MRRRAVALCAKLDERPPNCTIFDMATKSAKKGLYANIAAKKKRIAKGSGEKMKEPGSLGAPKEGAFEKAAKTTKRKP